MGSSTSTRATPASVAALITSTATVADTSRRRSMPGSSPFDGSETSVSLAIARAAARNSGSDITEARQTIVPSPSPGNISALLAWPIR